MVSTFKIKTSCQGTVLILVNEECHLFIEGEWVDIQFYFGSICVLLIVNCIITDDFSDWLFNAT